MTVTITADQALDLIRQVVTEAGPAHRYEQPPEGCSYLDPVSSAPSCLIGQAMAKAGVSVDVLSWLDRYVGTISNLRSGEEGYVLGGGALLTEGAIDVFAAAQTEQDRGKPWAEALAAAERMREEVRGE